MSKRAKNDLKMGIILGTLIAPFPILALGPAPWWAWTIYVAWWVLNIVANRPKKRKKRQKREFQYFDLIPKPTEKVELEDIA